jgi:hypothetical protein
VHFWKQVLLRFGEHLNAAATIQAEDKPNAERAWRETELLAAKERNENMKDSM